jgi:hypothetical protein
MPDRKCTVFSNALWTDLGILVVDLKESVLVCSLCEIVSTRLELEKL